MDRRPIVAAVAGPNGADKTTFFHVHIAAAALRCVSADVLAGELEIDAFETVFSDPVGDKLAFLKEAVAAGYAVVLCFIGLRNPALSEERVAMRVTQGGHDVPAKKLKSRFPRTLKNLKAAIAVLPLVGPAGPRRAGLIQSDGSCLPSRRPQRVLQARRPVDRHRLTISVVAPCDAP